MLALSAYDTYLDQLFDVMKRFTNFGKLRPCPIVTSHWR